MRVNAYEFTSPVTGDRAERWREHAIDSDEELAMAMDLLRYYVDKTCDCKNCKRGRALLGGGR